MPMRWQAGTGPSQLHLMASWNSQLDLMANSLPLRRFCFCSKLSAALAGCSAERRAAAACLLLNVQDCSRLLLLLPSHQHRPAAVVTVAQQSRAKPRTDSTHTWWSTCFTSPSTCLPSLPQAFPSLSCWPARVFLPLAPIAARVLVSDAQLCPFLTGWS